jgi:hypothetical protein
LQATDLAEIDEESVKEKVFYFYFIFFKKLLLFGARADGYLVAGYARVGGAKSKAAGLFPKIVFSFLLLQNGGKKTAMSIDDLKAL